MFVGEGSKSTVGGARGAHVGFVLLFISCPRPAKRPLHATNCGPLPCCVALATLPTGVLTWRMVEDPRMMSLPRAEPIHHTPFTLHTTIPHASLRAFFTTNTINIPTIYMYRCVDLVDVEDPRMDVCLYCLPPHRLRQNDVR